MEDGKTQVKLNLTTRRSVFLILKDKTTETASNADGISSDVIDTLPVNGQWTIKFADGKQVEWTSLMPWNESTDNDIKYFSGTARYSQHLYLKELNRNYNYVLDLGEVKRIEPQLQLCARLGRSEESRRGQGERESVRYTLAATFYH